MYNIYRNAKENAYTKIKDRPLPPPPRPQRMRTKIFYDQNKTQKLFETVEIMVLKKKEARTIEEEKHESTQTDPTDDFVLDDIDCNKNCKTITPTIYKALTKSNVTAITNATTYINHCSLSTSMIFPCDQSIISKEDQKKLVTRLTVKTDEYLIDKIDHNEDLPQSFHNISSGALKSRLDKEILENNSIQFTDQIQVTYTSSNSILKITSLKLFMMIIIILVLAKLFILKVDYSPKYIHHHWDFLNAPQ